MLMSHSSEECYHVSRVEMIARGCVTRASEMIRKRPCFAGKIVGILKFVRVKCNNNNIQRQNLVNYKHIHLLHEEKIKLTIPNLKSNPSVHQFGTCEWTGSNLNVILYENKLCIRIKY